jgi:hypothetical protein
MTVPFIGWSLAAQEFRRIVQKHAKKPVSVLIVGEHGVGKRTMAAVWRHVSGRNKKELPLVDLDAPPSTLPSPCIAVSTRPPASGREIPVGRAAPRGTREALLLHLDTGRIAPVPPEECGSSCLPDGQASQFKPRLYMPPLRRRQLDILAVLHFFGLRVLRPRIKAVSSALIHRLLLDSSWPGNVRSLLDYFCYRAAVAGESLDDQEESRSDSSSVGSTEQPSGEPKSLQGGITLQDDPFDLLPTKGLPLIQPPEPGQHFIPDPGKPKHLEHQRTNWVCEDVETPLSELPRVGLSILLAGVLLELEDPDQRRRSAYLPGPQHPLGSDRWWSKDYSWTQIRSLSEASMEELFTAYALGQKPKQGIFPELLATAARFLDFGASIASLQAGLRVRLTDVPLDLYDGSRPKGRKRTARSVKMSPEQRQVYQLVEIQGMHPKEAALQLGCTWQNVYKLLAKAIPKVDAASAGSRSVQPRHRVLEEKDSYREWEKRSNRSGE